MPSIGLVLGAGGIAGFSFHVGALAALAELTGWDPRDADLIVGTSAGANAAASLRAGLSAADHHAHGQGRPCSPEGQALGRYRGLDELDIPPRPDIGLLALLRPAAPWLVIPAFFPPVPWRLGLLLGLLPAGPVSGDALAERVRDLTDQPWPEAPTWICATRLRDGRRVVFGRDDVGEVELADAVQASSAVPAHLTPMTIHGRRYLDGAVISPTNADLVARLGFDLVVVISPMSTAGPESWVGRGLCAKMLGREVAAIRATGTEVLTIQPTPADIDAMGEHLMASDRGRRVAETAYASTRRVLDDPRFAAAAAMLRSTSKLVT